MEKFPNKGNRKVMSATFYSEPMKLAQKRSYVIRAFGAKDVADTHVQETLKFEVKF